MYYVIYKTTNKINGKFYIGKHQCENISDNYLGSGVLLRKAIKHYGKENFRKEILFIYETEEEMNDKEHELITEELISDQNCYNLTLGGEGGPIFKGRTHSKETRKKISEIRKYQNAQMSYEQKHALYEKRLQSRKNNGRPWVSDDSRKHMSELAFLRHRGYIPTQEDLASERKSYWNPYLSDEEKKIRFLEGNKRRSNTMTGHSVSLETREKLRKAKLGKPSASAGKIFVNDATKNYLILKENLDDYLSKGYIKGRLLKQNKH